MPPRQWSLPSTCGKTEAVWNRAALESVPLRRSTRAISIHDRTQVALAGALTGALWVNPPGAALAAENKLLQLRAARSAGLQVPDTLMSNDACHPGVHRPARPGHRQDLHAAHVAGPCGGQRGRRPLPGGQSRPPVPLPRRVGGHPAPVEGDVRPARAGPRPLLARRPAQASEPPLSRGRRARRRSSRPAPLAPRPPAGAAPPARGAGTP